MDLAMEPRCSSPCNCPVAAVSSECRGPKMQINVDVASVAIFGDLLSQVHTQVMRENMACDGAGMPPGL